MTRFRPTTLALAGAALIAATGVCAQTGNQSVQPQTTQPINPASPTYQGTTTPTMPVPDSGTVTAPGGTDTTTTTTDPMDAGTMTTTADPAASMDTTAAPDPAATTETTKKRKKPR